MYTVLLIFGIVALAVFTLMKLLEMRDWFKGLRHEYEARLWDAVYDAVGSVQQEIVIPAKLAQDGKLKPEQIAAANRLARDYTIENMKKQGIAIKEDLLNIKLPSLIEQAVNYLTTGKK